MTKELIDDAFYIEEKRWKTWQSHYPDGTGIITSLTKEECLKASRWYLKSKQEGEFDKSPEKTYSTKDNYKL